jgi:hypothetical protein
MRIAATFDPATETSTTFNAGFPNGQGKMVVYNESNINLTLAWGSFQTYCPAWTAMLYCVNTNDVNINWTIQSQLQSGGSPISQVIVETYNQNEPVLGTFPAPLVRSTNIGNSVPLGTSSISISNTGNSPLTPIIEVQPSDATSNTIYCDNSGNFTVFSDNAGSLSSLLQLIGGASPAVIIGNSGLLAQVLGSLTIAGNGIINGQLTTGDVLLVSSGSDPKISSDSSGDINLDVPAGTRIMQINSGGVDLTTVGKYALTAKAINFTTGSLSRVSQFSGTGNGTFNHGLGVTPDYFCTLACNTSNSSQTIGIAGKTSTQCTVTTGGGLGWSATAYAK